MRAIIIKSTNGFQYEVVNTFAYELGQGLVDIGWEVEYLDWSIPREDFLVQLVTKIQKGIDVILHFNGFLVMRDPIAKIIYNCINACNIPVGVFLVDHPFYHSQHLKDFDQKNTFVTMYDTGHLNAYNNFVGHKNQAYQLMHGGSVASKSFDNKVYDVMIAGTIGEPTDFDTFLVDLGEGIFQDIFKEIYENAEHDYTTSLDVYFERSIKKRGINPQAIANDEEIAGYMHKIFTYLDKYFRQLIRFNALATLLDAGIDVHLFGKCEVEELKDYPNLHIHGAVEYEKLLEEMTKSKIIVHDLNTCTNGSHERVLSGMMNNALVISNKMKYCNGDLKDGESIVFYDVHNPQDLVDKVNYYLENEDERTKITKKAYDVVSEKHTWKNRAVELSKYIEQFTKR